MHDDFVETAYGKIPTKELIVEVPSTMSLIDLPDIYFLNENNNKRLPAMLDPKLAYFAGYFFGDGGLKDIKKTYLKTKRFEYKIKIADEFFLQIKFIQELFRDLFGKYAPIRAAKEGRFFYIDPTCKDVYLFLTKVFELPPGPKSNILRLPAVIKSAGQEIKKWFVRGVFDADGDTRAVEHGFNSQSRVKLRMKSKLFIYEMKELLSENFNVSVNGPYFDKVTNSAYIQVERHADIISLGNQKLFIHPIKRWRLEKARLKLLDKANV